MVRHQSHFIFSPSHQSFYDMFESECGNDFEIRKKQQRIIYALDKYGLDPIRIKTFYYRPTVAQRMYEADPFWERYL